MPTSIEYSPDSCESESLSRERIVAKQGLVSNLRPGSVSRVLSILNIDFCPQFNRYLYWLKEPVGWFVLAAMVSLLVGAFLSPIGWTLAAGLIAMIVAGLAIPWIAVHCTDCRLEPVSKEISEFEPSQLLLTVRNRLPLPLWGLMVEGYLTAPVAQAGWTGEVSLDLSLKPDVGLASVPPLCEATFRLAIQPEYRGSYPVEAPCVACAFPFGIWTARRSLQSFVPITVWPMRLDLNALLDIGGTKATDEGSGERLGTSGEFLGVRAFRRGDSLRSIHWVQTARMDSLVVCDRSGPQRQTVSLELDTQPNARGENVLAAREHLAWRVRIVASLGELLCARHIPFQLVIDNDALTLAPGKRGLEQALNRLAALPLDRLPNPCVATRAHECRLATRICVGCHGSQHSGSKSDTRYVGIVIHQPSTGLRSHSRRNSADIDLTEELTAQLNHFLSEVSYASFAA